METIDTIYQKETKHVPTSFDQEEKPKLSVEPKSMAIIQSHAMTVNEKAELIELRNDQDYQAAMTILGMAKDGIRQAEELFKPIKQAHDAAKKVVLMQEKGLLEKFEPAKKLLESKCFAYRQEQERRAREEQAKLAALARKEAEEAALHEALTADAMGQKEVVDQILETPVYVPPPAPRAAVPKVEGLSFQKNWKGRVVNQALMPENYKLPNQVAIDNHARSLKEKACIPGVEFYYTESSRRS